MCTEGEHGGEPGVTLSQAEELPEAGTEAWKVPALAPSGKQGPADHSDSDFLPLVW